MALGDYGASPNAVTPIPSASDDIIVSTPIHSPSPTPSHSPTPSPTLPAVRIQGDVTCDGLVNARDVLNNMRHVANLAEVKLQGRYRSANPSTNAP